VVTGFRVRPLGAGLLFINVFSLWLYSTSRSVLTSINISSAPLMQVNPLFWVALLFPSVVLIWADCERLRIIAMCLICFFVFGGIAIIEPLGGLHDSISNIALGSSYLQGTLPESAAPYVFNFPGAYTFLGIT